MFPVPQRQSRQAAVNGNVAAAEHRHEGEAGMLAEQQRREQQHKLQPRTTVDDANVQETVIGFRIGTDRQSSAISGYIVHGGEPGGWESVLDPVAFDAQRCGTEGKQRVEDADNVSETAHAECIANFL